jgi:hypothetical protein
VPLTLLDMPSPARSTRWTGSLSSLLDTAPPELRNLFDGFGGLVIRYKREGRFG